MSGVEDIFSVYYIALSFAGILALLWVVFEFSEKKPSRERKKLQIFSCGMGESPKQMNVPSMNYYEYMKRFFRTDYLASIHSGKLSRYVAWIYVGMALILSVLLILW